MPSFEDLLDVFCASKMSLYENILGIQKGSSDNLLWDRDTAELICIIHLADRRYRICCN